MHFPLYILQLQHKAAHNFYTKSGRAEEKKKMLSVTRSILLFADRALKCYIIKSHFLTSKSQKCIRCTWKRHHSGDHFIKHEKNWIWLRSGCKNLHLNTVHPYEILAISKSQISQTITSYTKLPFLIFCPFSPQFFKHHVIIMLRVCAHTRCLMHASLLCKLTVLHTYWHMHCILFILHIAHFETIHKYKHFFPSFWRQIVFTSEFFSDLN